MYSPSTHSDDEDLEDSTQGLLGAPKPVRRPSRRRLCFPRRIFLRRPANSRYRYRRVSSVLLVLWAAFVCLFVFESVFGSAGYMTRAYPKGYSIVQDSVMAGGGVNPEGFWSGDMEKRTQGGRGNPKKEKVFIAANIVDAELVAGAWGEAVMELMDLIGEENVFLSVFENDSGRKTTVALNNLAARISARMPKANHSIISTELPYGSFPRIRLPNGNGETVLKRIEYLAAIRNRVMLPFVHSIPSLKPWGQSKDSEAQFLRRTEVAYNAQFTTGSNVMKRSGANEWEVEPNFDFDASRPPKMPDTWVENPEEFSRVLFLNDVIFDPVQAAHLLFSTNGGKYTSACGMDFVYPFLYYDTFATRDTDGYLMAVPFFPFFVPGSKSRKYVRAWSDAVPVKSCWGGIAAFDAQVFRADKATPAPDSASAPAPAASTPNRPLMFRTEKAPYWEASECCLIHADIAAPDSTFINPFVRVAYKKWVYAWLPAFRRVERLFSGLHWVVAKLLHAPWGSENREDGGAGYCGARRLMVMREDRPGDRYTGGGSPWKELKVPQGNVGVEVAPLGG